MLKQIRKTIFIAVVAIQILSCSNSKSDELRPNIVFVLCDDLGYGDVNAMAPEYCNIPTPNADKLASEGVVFTNAHSGGSVCTPTRYGLLTGRYGMADKVAARCCSGYRWTID